MRGPGNAQRRFWANYLLMKITWHDRKLRLFSEMQLPTSRMNFKPQLQLLCLNQLKLVSALHFPEYTCLNVRSALLDFLLLKFVLQFVSFFFLPCKRISQALLFKSAHFILSCLPCHKLSCSVTEHYLHNLFDHIWHVTWLIIIDVQNVYTWSIYFVDVSWRSSSENLVLFFLLGGKCTHKVQIWGNHHHIVSLLSVQGWLSFPA